MRQAGLIGAIVSLVLLGGCIIIGNSCSAPSHKAQRTQVIAGGSIGTGKLLTAETQNGNIDVHGQTAETCEVTVTITARGNRPEEAQSLVESTQVSLIPSDQGLTVSIQKPESELAKHISVSLDISIPSQSRLNLKTSNGNITIDAIEQTIDLGTSNGNVTLTKTAGPLNAHTSNGNVNCSGIQNNITARSSNGDIHVAFDKAAGAAKTIDLGTSNGSITLTPGDHFSATVSASTSNGKVSCNRPITVRGDMSKTSIEGTIGTGEGICKLYTSNGSIQIR